MKRLVVTAAIWAMPLVAFAQEHEEAHHFDRLSYFAAVINFLLLLLLLVKMAGKPTAEFLKNRRASIETEITEAAKMKAAAEAKQREYADRLAKLDSEIDALKAEMVKAGEAERDRIIAEAKAKAERTRKDAEFVIDQQLKQLRIDLTKESVAAAVAAANKLLAEKTTAADQERIARDYLARIAGAAKGGQA